MSIIGYDYGNDRVFITLEGASTNSGWGNYGTTPATYLIDNVRVVLSQSGNFGFVVSKHTKIFKIVTEKVLVGYKYNGEELTPDAYKALLTKYKSKKNLLTLDFDDPKLKEEYEKLKYLPQVEANKVYNNVEKQIPIEIDIKYKNVDDINNYIVAYRRISGNVADTLYCYKRWDFLHDNVVAILTKFNYTVSYSKTDSFCAYPRCERDVQLISKGQYSDSFIRSGKVRISGKDEYVTIYFKDLNKLDEKIQIAFVGEQKDVLRVFEKDKALIQSFFVDVKTKNEGLPKISQLIDPKTLSNKLYNILLQINKVDSKSKTEKEYRQLQNDARELQLEVNKLIVEYEKENSKELVIIE